MSRSADSLISLGAGKLTGVRGPGWLVLAAAQLTRANTATGTGKAREGVEKHQTPGPGGQRSEP